MVNKALLHTIVRESGTSDKPADPMPSGINYRIRYFSVGNRTIYRVEETTEGWDDPDFQVFRDSPDYYGSFNLKAADGTILYVSHKVHETRESYNEQLVDIMETISENPGWSDMMFEIITY